MIRFITSSLMRRLVLLFLAGTLIPVVVVISLHYYSFSNTIELSVLNTLTATSEAIRIKVIDFLRDRTEDVEVLVAGRDVARAMELLRLESIEGERDADGAAVSEEHTKIRNEIDPFFEKYLSYQNYRNIYLLDGATGRVVYSTEKKTDSSTSQERQKNNTKQTGLIDLWETVTASGSTTMIDFTSEGVLQTPLAFIGAPYHDEEGGIVAVLAISFSAQPITSLLQNSLWLDGAEKIYLVGNDLLSRSSVGAGTSPRSMSQRLDIPPVRWAFEGKSGTTVTEGLNGEKLLSSYTPVRLGNELGFDFEWIVVSAVPKAEAMASLQSLELRIFILGLGLAVVVCLWGFLFARKITLPLRDLSQKVARMADGDLSVTVEPGNRSDEVGVLMRGVRDMLEALRHETRHIMDGANSLASSISEISATASMLASSAMETSTSISEITTTVEEVKQIAHISNDKAGEVQTQAENVAQISGRGKQATEDATTGMSRIKEEMEYVAESIVKLSEQTQSIGEIINAVNDLADQSNLLSVNASIEAAKAGEYGKGFAVVAQEVKTLADQSKDATEQVRTILNDIQKATSAAVMSTERGSKTVENGAQLSFQAGEAIGTLIMSVTESEQAATQIATSSQEQLLGIDHLAEAMESIKEATTQNVDAARQLESATHSMNALAQKLKDMAGRFKI